MDAASPKPSTRVAIIGGGISGLAAAHRLHELAPHLEWTLYERESRLGGVLHTERRDGFLLEWGADMFTCREPWALQLCQRLGLAEELIRTNADHRRAFVVRQGRLVAVPDGFTLMSPARLWPIVQTPLLTWRGKLRLACEPFIEARRGEEDESLADFARRRVGDEAYRRLVQPLIGGIYTADPEQLSMQAALPQMVAMEREHGSLVRGARAEARRRGGPSESGARYGMFLAPRYGMQQLVDALQHRLPPQRLRLQTAVTSLRYEPERGREQWVVQTEPASAGAPTESEQQAFDQIIIAAPARLAAHMLHDVDSRLGELLQIPAASAAVVLFGCRRAQIRHPLNGVGFVVPFCEQRQILSTSFASMKFPQRAPDGHVLLRTFVGGACQAELVDLPDAALLELVRSELEELIGLEGQPVLQQVVRWKDAMPQYHLGHRDRVGAIEHHRLALEGLHLAGNAYGGVGIPFCIRSGEAAAEAVLCDAPRGAVTG